MKDMTISHEDLVRAMQFAHDLANLTLHDPYFIHNYGIAVEKLTTEQAMEEFRRAHFGMHKKESVVAIIMDEQHNVLLLKRHPYDRTLPNVWCLPGGKVDKDEDRITALNREVEEETGLKLSRFDKVYEDSNAKFNIHFYRAEGVNVKDVKISDEHSEYAWVNLFSLSEVSGIAPVTLKALHEFAILISD